MTVRFCPLPWLIAKAQEKGLRKGGKDMGHTLRIGVEKRPRVDDRDLAERIVSCRRVTLRERLLRRLLGMPRRLTILVPGDSVKTLSIIEEGRCTDEPDE
jgi:hypothetical protein